MEWCTNCKYKDNKAAYGNNVSSPFHDLIDIYSNIPRKLHQKLPFNVNVSLYDEFNQSMAKMNYVVDITMNISNSKVKLVTNDESVTNGTYTQSTNNGYTEILLYIQPIDTIKYEEITIDLELEIVVITPSLNTTTKRIYYLTFKNEIYHIPSSIYIQSYLMMFIAVIFRYNDHAIISKT